MVQCQYVPIYGNVEEFVHALTTHSKEPAHVSIYIYIMIYRHMVITSGTCAPVPAKRMQMKVCIWLGLSRVITGPGRRGM